ncbi:cholecystokinin receptor type A-like [Mytilus californianus]|uniref:cholecystokinin receptor type A-like n=1 Tax=Mytilus californianus TaxID=6549 RepID=UPI002245A852|nr:cholecystokinin receptor type A-like [Mytilus californianus]
MLSYFSQVTPTISHTTLSTLRHDNTSTSLVGHRTTTGAQQKVVSFVIPADRLLPEPHPKYLTDIFFVLFVMIIFFSVVGNGLVIAISVKARKLKTVTDIYIMSLAINDLLIATLNMPFQLYFTVVNEWMTGGKTGEALCKFTNYIQGCTIISSIFTLLAIAVDRYFVICRAKISQQRHRQKTAIIAVIAVWIVSMLIVIPHLLYQKLQIRLKISTINGLLFFDGIRYICVEEFPSYPVINAQRLYSLIQYIGCYLIPVVIMAFTYGRIGHRLWIHQPIGDILANPRNHGHIIKQKKRIIRMLMLLFLSFTLLWFPFFTFALYSEYVAIDKSYRVKLTALKLVGYSNCCVNPIIYTFLNKNFRQDLSNLFCRKTTALSNQRRPYETGNQTGNSRF